MSTTIFIYCDGGSRGNPGPAAIGIAAKIRMTNDETRNLKNISKCIGIATNNQAEYKAVIEALRSIIEMRNEKLEDTEIKFFLDSELVVEQLNGRYKIKNEGLKPLYWEVRDLLLKFGGKVTFSHITRDKNKEADKLVNEALDKENGK